MPSEVVILEGAQQDVRRIAAYLAGQSGNGAVRRFMDEFRKQVELVSQTPELYGLSRFEDLAAKGYRRFPINSYMALYRLRGERIVIEHVFHQQQDYPHIIAPLQE